MTMFSLDKLGYCQKSVPGQILSKLDQNPSRLCKKWGSTGDASTLVGIQGLHLDRAGGMI